MTINKPLAATPAYSASTASERLRLHAIGCRLRSVFDTPAGFRSREFDDALRRLEKGELK